MAGTGSGQRFPEEKMVAFSGTVHRHLEPQTQGFCNTALPSGIGEGVGKCALSQDLVMHVKSFIYVHSL